MGEEEAVLSNRKVSLKVWNEFQLLVRATYKSNYGHMDDCIEEALMLWNEKKKKELGIDDKGRLIA